ncbi:MAG: M16 family metallopeptidase [Bacteroidota bacterium]
MKRLILLLVIFSSIGLAQKIQVPPATRHTLDNGLTIILMQYKKVPVVHFRLVARGGSAEDPAGLEGVASIATSLMREGTTTRSSNDIATAIDFVGGSLFASAGVDYCAIRGEVLKKDLDTGLDLFADILLNPSFPEEEIERERKQRLASLDALKEEPGSIASRVFTQALYGSHPYGKQLTRVSLDGVTRDHLVQFHHRIFVPNNSVLVVVGDFAEQEMLALLKQKLNGWQRGETSAQSFPLPTPGEGRRLVMVDKSDATQTQIRMGNVGIDIKNPDFFAVAVANTIFGSGFTSRLVEELRVKRSLTYSASSNFPANLFGGSFSISTFTKNETTGETIDVILEEVKKYREKGATPDELTKAHNYLSGGFARGLQSPEALAARMTDIEFYGFPKDYLESYIQKLKSVTLADVRRVVAKYFAYDDLLFVLVAPAESTRGAVEKYGAVNVMSLDDAVK